MLERLVRTLILDRLRRYPAVALVGPRQCGKTTLARSIAGSYFDLETEGDRVRLDVEWETVLGAASGGPDAPPGPVVLDEAQSWPEVFPRLRAGIDARRKQMGRFLILGSIAPSLMRTVSESLAGRLSIVELTPFLAVEIPKGSTDDLWLRGSYPDGGVFDPARFPQWQHDYLALLTQRDLPNWGLPAKPQVTQRLIRILAAVHGQLWNASQIASAMGLSYPTVNSYLDFLEGAFLIRRLFPYFADIKKRLVKSPKVYWRDSGLLHALLQATTRDELLARPWVGQSWEGFVIEQILGFLLARGDPAAAFFFRTSDRQELDLVLERRGELWAIEIKLTSNPRIDDLERLDRTADLIGAGKRILISRVPEPAEEKGRLSCSLDHFLSVLPEMA